jgi:hypothetical protein
MNGLSPQRPKTILELPSDLGFILSLEERTRILQRLFHRFFINGALFIHASLLYIIVYQSP